MSAISYDGQWYPMYEIALIRDYANYELLQEYKELQGQPIYYNMMGSKDRYNKYRMKRGRESNEATGRIRTDWQSGKRLMTGPIP